MPKIVWAELSRIGNSFALDDEKFFVGNTGYILTLDVSDRAKLLYLLAVLNSRVILYQIDRLTTRFDKNGWRWLRQFVENLRVPYYEKNEELCALANSSNAINQFANSEIKNKNIYSIFDFSLEETEYINKYLQGY